MKFVDVEPADPRLIRELLPALLAELTARARQAGCAVVDLDSAVHQAYAHRFCAREGMTIDAFRFSLTVGGVR